MAPCPWFAEFARWSEDHRDHDVGLSLTFLSEHRDYRWTSVAPPSEIPSLIGADGYLPRSLTQFVVKTPR